MSSVSVTRMELLAHKAQLSLASQGRDLLEQKRTALLKEFLRMADTAIERSDALQYAADNARHALARAESVAGAEAVRSAALASRADRHEPAIIEPSIEPLTSSASSTPAPAGLHGSTLLNVP